MQRAIPWCIGILILCAIPAIIRASLSKDYELLNHNMRTSKEMELDGVKSRIYQRDIEKYDPMVKNTRPVEDSYIEVR